MKIFSEGVTTFFFCSYGLTASSTFESFYAFRWFDVTVVLKFLNIIMMSLLILTIGQYNHYLW